MDGCRRESRHECDQVIFCVVSELVRGSQADRRIDAHVGLRMQRVADPSDA
jgi:hypothetical protein